MLKTMLITNNPEIALIAQDAGVDRIWIDLEKLGKQERQANQNSVKSDHCIDDIKRLRPLISQAQLMVRVDPLNPNSKQQINEVIECGAELVMLPMFKDWHDAEHFVRLVDGRAKTILLLETIGAEKSIDETLRVTGVDEIHIGLNDLHLEHKMRFMFELLADGTVDRLCDRIGTAGIPFGFGGVAKLGTGLLPAEMIIAEHYRLKSSMVILSRGFCPEIDETKEYSLINDALKFNMQRLREYETLMKDKSQAFFQDNRANVSRIVKELVVSLPSGDSEHEK